MMANQYMLTSGLMTGVTNTVYVSGEVFAALRPMALSTYHEALDGPDELHVLTLSLNDLCYAYNED